MLNQIVVVGRVSALPTDYICDGMTYKKFTIVVPRVGTSSKDDAISILVTENIADNMSKYCKVKDIIGVKGSLRNYDNILHVFGEKITFLSNNHIEGGE